MLWDLVTFPPVLVHHVNVHLGLDVAVQMVNPLESDKTEFTSIGRLSRVYSQVILEIVSRTELFTTDVTGLFLCFVPSFYMSS